ncbi:MAG: hypothetical protein OEW80_02590 [Gemmatimonadota bacterium]|nr:hypothetical protein [Gemmatimonadota bacterium]
MREALDAWETRSVATVAPYYAQVPGRLFFDSGSLKYTSWDAYAADAGPAFASFKSATFTLGDDTQGEQLGDMAWRATTLRSLFTLAGWDDSSPYGPLDDGLGPSARPLGDRSRPLLRTY